MKCRLYNRITGNEKFSVRNRISCFARHFAEIFMQLYLVIDVRNGSRRIALSTGASMTPEDVLACTL